jgi:hypothetical protein
MFAVKTKPVTVKDEELGEIVVTIRKLSGSSLEKAAVQRGIVQAAYFRALGAPFLQELSSPKADEARKILADEKKDPAALRKARYAQYDRDSVLIAGIERWSCEDKYPKSESITKLDEDTAQELHEAILDYSLPPITIEEAKEVPKGA